MVAPHGAYLLGFVRIQLLSRGERLSGEAEWRRHYCSMYRWLLFQMEVFVFVCQICSSQIKEHFSECIVCSEAWAVFTEGDTEKWLGYHVKLGRRGLTEELAFALADVCGKCAVTPQAGAAPRLVSLNVWGAALLPLRGSHPWEQLEGEASVRTKILLLVTCSFSFSQCTASTPAPRFAMSLQPDLQALCLLARGGSQHLSLRRLGMSAVGDHRALWVVGHRNRVQGCVLARPMQPGPLPKIAGMSLWTVVWERSWLEGVTVLEWVRISTSVQMRGKWEEGSLWPYIIKSQLQFCWKRQKLAKAFRGTAAVF